MKVLIWSNMGNLGFDFDFRFDFHFDFDFVDQLNFQEEYLLEMVSLCFRFQHHKKDIFPKNSNYLNKI